MATHETTEFLSGVIEGFYGQPWTQAQRFELFDWLAGWGLNTYFYAPKDDLKHRALWRELYSAAEGEQLAQLIQGCRQRNLRFIYALSPGLDIRYSQKAELDHLRKRFEQMLALGCQHFSLLFDDIPDRLDTEDIQRWGSLASAQCHVANALFQWTRERSPGARFLFCPTPYCGRMAQGKLGGADYLSTVGRELLPGIDVFWTGPEIISREITVAHVQELQGILRRKPLIWDNLHANDYDGRRFFCGPYAGRPLEVRSAVSGLLSNPNCEFPLNYVPLRTLAEFVRCQGTWDPRRAYLSAMREWLAYFETIGQPITLEDLVLFGDCYYLPHEEGPEAQALYELAKGLLAVKDLFSARTAPPLPERNERGENSPKRIAGLEPLNHPLTPSLSPSGGEGWGEGAVHGEGRGEGYPTADAPAQSQARRPSSPPPSPPSVGGEGVETGVPNTRTINPAELAERATVFRKQATRLRELCVRLTALLHRPLFYALSRRIWELREELDLLEQYVEAKFAMDRPEIPSLTSHLPGTYRGGMVARLQRLLIQRPDGTFTP